MCNWIASYIRRFGFLARRAGRDAARQIWRVRRKIATGALDDDQEAMHVYPLSPACFRMLLYVPGAKSSDGCPAIVTRPAFVVCLN